MSGTTTGRPVGPFARLWIMDRGLAILGLVSIALVVIIARYFARAIAAGIPDDFAGPTIFIGGPGLVALFFSIVFFAELSGRALASPCPVCGDDRARRYGDDLARCKACLAYLRAEGSQISEERPSRSEDSQPYRLSASDLGRRRKLAQAACCAVCGADEVIARRGAKPHRPVKVSTGLEGVAGAFGHVPTVMDRARSGSLSPRASSKEPLHLELVYGLCHKHQSFDGDAVEYDDDQVRFRNYRCYRETVRNNALGRPPG